MVGKCGVVTTTVFCMQHQRHIQYLCFQLRELSIRAKHLKNIFRNRHLFIRKTDDQCIIRMEMPVSTIGMNSNLRHLCNELQGLAQYIGHRHFIRVRIIAVQRQNTSLQCIHLILIGCLHNHIPKELSGQLLKTLDNTDKASKLFRCWQTSEQQKIGCFLESIPAVFKSGNQLLYIISLEIKFTICRHLLAIHTLIRKDIGNLGKTCQYTFTIGITQSSLYVILCI